MKLSALAAVAVSIWALFNYALIPVANTTAISRLALTRVPQTHDLLDNAAILDPLDPAPLTLNARLYAEHYEQTNARLQRQGQEYPVMIHRLLATGTVDEDIVDRTAGKASVQELLMRALK